MTSATWSSAPDLGIGLHTPYPNPDKKGYYNISSFKDGLGFHLAVGYPF